jgi:hypothetical protein
LHRLAAAADSHRPCATPPPPLHSLGPQSQLAELQESHAAEVTSIKGWGATQLGQHVKAADRIIKELEGTASSLQQQLAAEVERAEAATAAVKRWGWAARGRQWAGGRGWRGHIMTTLLSSCWGLLKRENGLNSLRCWKPQCMVDVMCLCRLP